MRRFVFYRDPDPEQFGTDVDTFLEVLGGPACLFFTGADESRTRAFVTLLHGNEPSGVMALFRWLRAQQRPAVNIVCIVPSVAAALEHPRFSHRMLPRARDLNRCFRPPFDDSQGRLAEEILEIFRFHHPEAVVDMHNTSGSGPGFGVVTYMDNKHDALVSLFNDRLIISNLGLGALMEISEHLYPTVTVEVGGRQDEAAHALAWEGLCRYFTTEQVFNHRDTDWGLEVLHDPIRLELAEHTTLTYGDEPSRNHDVTLKTDIEHHNFGTVTARTLLGWLRGDPRDLFLAQDRSGTCAVERLVREEQGVLYPAADLKLFMITNNPDIASADCVFYAVSDDGSAL